MAENNSRETFKYVEWKINGIVDRFRGFQENGRKEEIKSPRFSFNNAEWFLNIRSNTLENATLFIGLHMLNPEEHDVKFRIGMQKSDGSNTNIIEDLYTFAGSCNNCTYDFSKEFALLERSTDILTQDGTLTIFCFICLNQKPPMDNESQTPVLEAEMPPIKRSKTDSDIPNKDVKLIVDGEEFLANRFILLQSYEYFKGLLNITPVRHCDTTNMEVHFIPLGDKASFDVFLKFVYKRDIDIVTPNNMFGLYRNSHICGVLELKEECIRFMKQELSMRTFIDIYDWSCEFEDTDLLNSSIQFFNDNARNIVITTKWQEYLEKKPLSGNKLFLNCLSSSNSN